MRRFLLALIFSAVSAGSAYAQLIIAGGGLKSETEDVWRAFIDRAEGDGDFVIVPSASGSPVESAASVKKTLVLYGVDPARISTAPLAVRDDRSTDDVDEATWKDNANNEAIAAQLSAASALWFTGGDQARTTKLLQPKGKSTPALDAIRQAHARGAPIGGTSAGAAIMSEVMILQGDSLTALTNSKSGERLELGNGLAFLPRGIVDQHFGERARLGRLAVAIAQQKDPANRFGLGIDENTALIYNKDGSVEVAGSGYITIVDARNATAKRIKGRVQLLNLEVNLVSRGDTVDLMTLAVTPAEWKSATLGNEYVSTASLGGGGMAMPGQSLFEVIGNGLIDNVESQSIERISFDSEGRGVGYVFTQTNESEGFWGRGPDGSGQYMIANIRFDIVPLKITLETLR